MRINQDQINTLTRLAAVGGTVPTIAALIRLSRWYADGKNNKPAYDAMHRLRRNGWVDMSADSVTLTDAGRRAAGLPAPEYVSPAQAAINAARAGA